MDFIQNFNEEKIIISNNGDKIEKTNYWETELSETGVFYMSVHKDCYRLLVPKDEEEDFISRISAAKKVTISSDFKAKPDPMIELPYLIQFTNDNDSKLYEMIIMGSYWDCPTCYDHFNQKGKMAIYCKPSNTSILHPYKEITNAECINIKVGMVGK